MSNANRIKAKTPGYCLQPFQYIFVWRWVLACMVKSTHTAHRHRHTHAFNDVYEQCSVCVCVYCIAFDRTIINNNPQRLPLIHSGDHIRFNWIWHSSYIIPRSSACRREYIYTRFYFNFFPISLSRTTLEFMRFCCCCFVISRFCVLSFAPQCERLFLQQSIYAYQCVCKCDVKS